MDNRSEVRDEANATVADEGLTLLDYAADPGSRFEDGLDLLASWAATAGTLDQPQTEHAMDRARRVRRR